MDFYLWCGEMVFLGGYFGVGKSILFKLICVIECLIDGKISFNGYDIIWILNKDIFFLCCNIGIVF